MTALDGRVAVVTGASRGIGRAIAVRLTGEGATVLMLARNVPMLDEAARAAGGGAVPLPCDVGDERSIARAVKTIRRDHGTPDIIVNNAGLFHVLPVEQTSVAQFTEMLTVNLVAPFTLVRAFLAEMRARKSGHVVTIGSIADRATFPENGGYAASNPGLRAFHEVVRSALRGSGVRATLVSPGPVDTPLWDPIDPDHRDGFTPRSAMLAADAVAVAVHYAITQPGDVNVDELRLSRS